MERVAFVARWAGADGVVPDGMTASIEAAPAGTRVLALLAEAGLVLRTVRAEDALGPAVWCTAKVAGEAGTGAAAADHLLGAEGAAHVPGAGIPRVFLHIRFPRAFLKCIPNEASWTGAGGDVVEDAALGVGATGARARVHALAVGAGLLP